MQTLSFPLSVGVTQQRQTPNPQAIMFSSETSQSMPWISAIPATAFIIKPGPQQYTFLKGSLSFKKMG